MTIIARKNGKKFENIEKTNFNLEENLQKLIHDDQIMKKINLGFAEDKTLVTLSREFESGSGPIDVLAVDEDGSIYIIETKLIKNYDRRKILAQIMDYAGGMWDRFLDDSINKFEKQLLQHNSTSKENIMLSGKSLSKIISDFNSLHKRDIPIDVDNIIMVMKNNFYSGQFKFIVVFDKLDDHLMNTINYLNEKSPMTIYAVTYDYYVDNNLEILIPTVYGRAAEQRSEKKAGVRIPWTLEETKQNFKKKLTPREYEMFEKLYKFLNENSDGINPGTGISGSISPVFNKLRRPEMDGKGGSFLTLDVGGVMKINYPWLKLELRKKIAESFSDNTELKTDAKSKLLSDIDLDNTYPPYSRDQWSNNVDSIIETIKKFI